MSAADRPTAPMVLESIMRDAEHTFMVPRDRIVGRCRQLRLLQARIAIAHAMRESKLWSLVEIGQVLGGRDHTSISHLTKHSKMGTTAREFAKRATAALASLEPIPPPPISEAALPAPVVKPRAGRGRNMATMVAQAMGIQTDLLLDGSRTLAAIMDREIATLLMREAGLSFHDIARELVAPSHSTLVTAVPRAKARLTTDPAFHARYRAARARLSAQGIRLTGGVECVPTAPAPAPQENGATPRQSHVVAGTPPKTKSKPASPPRQTPTVEGRTAARAGKSSSCCPYGIDALANRVEWMRGHRVELERMKFEQLSSDLDAGALDRDVVYAEFSDSDRNALARARGRLANKKEKRHAHTP